MSSNIKFKVGDVVICNDSRYTNLVGPIIRHDDARVPGWYYVEYFGEKFPIFSSNPDQWVTFYSSEIRLATDLEKALHE